MTRVAILLAVFASCFHTAASAQGPSRLTRHAERADAGNVARIWAECVADIERDWARQMLETLPTSAAEEQAFERHEGHNDRCLTNPRLLMDGKQVTIPVNVSRGEIARFLVRLEVRQGNGQPVAGNATAWLRDSLATRPANEGYDRATLIGHQFALCMADEHWASVRDLVVAQEGSNPEAAAFSALAPKFGGCMAAGANLKLSKPLVRLLLSESAYHALTHKQTEAAR